MVKKLFLSGAAPVALALLLGVAAPAAAQDVMFKDKPPSQDEVKELFRGWKAPAQAGAANAPRTRKLILDEDPAPAPGPAPVMEVRAEPEPASARPARTRPTQSAAVSAPPPPPPPSGPTALAVPVQFRSGSAALLPQAHAYLDAVGAVLSEEKDVVVVVEGHTDAVGSDELNNALSLQRAWAVAAYLNSVHKVEMNRLQVVGKGESEPLPGLNPYDGRNRRVQFRAPQG